MKIPLRHAGKTDLIQQCGALSAKRLVRRARVDQFTEEDLMQQLAASVEVPKGSHSTRDIGQGQKFLHCSREGGFSIYSLRCSGELNTRRKKIFAALQCHMLSKGVWSVVYALGRGILGPGSGPLIEGLA